MAWAKVDDGWWCHPKVMGLPLSARGLWVSALSWSCQQRNPVVPVTFLSIVGASVDDAETLMDHGLWVPHADGFEIHDWSEYQEKSVSEKRAEAGRKGGLSRANASKAQAKAKQTDLPEQANGQAGALPSPSLPDPSPPPPTPQCEELPDEQTIRRTAVLVGRTIAGNRDDGGAYASGITRRILKDPITGADDLARITVALTEGQDPEAIAAGWVNTDPHHGLFPSHDKPHAERHGPAMPEFRGFQYDDKPATEAASWADEARAALRGGAA